MEARDQLKENEKQYEVERSVKEKELWDLEDRVAWFKENQDIINTDTSKAEEMAKEIWDLKE